MSRHGEKKQYEDLIVQERTFFRSVFDMLNLNFSSELDFSVFEEMVWSLGHLYIPLQLKVKFKRWNSRARLPGSNHSTITSMFCARLNFSMRVSLYI